MKTLRKLRRMGIDFETFLWAVLGVLFTITTISQLILFLGDIVG